MSSYEETVLLPVSSYLDMCDDADEEGGADLFPMAKAESVLEMASSIQRAVSGGDPDAWRHWSQFFRGGVDDNACTNGGAAGAAGDDPKA